jgi:hypothetical protein
MSGRLVSRVLESNLRPDLKFTAVVLASFGDDEGYHIRPAMRHVAHLRGLEERQAKYHVKELRRLEILDIVHPATQWQPTDYRMRVEKLPPRIAYRPPDRQRDLWPPGESPGPPDSGVQSTAPPSGVQSSVPGVQPTAPDPSVRSVSTRTDIARARGDAAEHTTAAGGENRRADNGAAMQPSAPLNELPLVGMVTRDRDHAEHAWCGRVCVPKFLHRAFKRALGGPIVKRPARLKAFYTATIAAIPAARDIGDEPVRFWRTAFATRFSSAAPRRGAEPMAMIDYANSPEQVARREQQDRERAYCQARDAEIATAIDRLSPETEAFLRALAADELAPFKSKMAPGVYDNALRLAMIRCVVVSATNRTIAETIADLGEAAARDRRQKHG